MADKWVLLTLQRESTRVGSPWFFTVNDGPRLRIEHNSFEGVANKNMAIANEEAAAKAVDIDLYHLRKVTVNRRFD